MAFNPRNRGPLRTLAALFVIVFGLYGFLGAVSTWGDAQRAPKLGLDLEGGTQLILQPKIVGNQKINEGQITKAVDIIRQRVNGSGIEEAEVTTQGGSNIVISLPGSPDKATIASLQKSSQLRFRAVLVEGSAAPTAVPTPTSTPTSTATSTAGATSKATAKATGTATPTAKSGYPPALAAATTPAPTGTATPGATPTANPTTAPAANPQNPSDLAWITPDVEVAYTALDCANPKDIEAIVDDPAKPMVTCSVDGRAKYILGPAEVLGSEVSDATSGQQQTQGGSTGIWEVRLDFNAAGTKAFGDVTSRLVVLQPPRNQFAIVLDNLVISAPVTQAALTAGNASITGSFTAASAKVLADQIKFGALPMSFELQTQDTISPTLGGDQLRRGLLAGLIGLILVVLYSLFQYRALGLVTVSSLVIAASITYATVTLFGWSYGYRLTMAGVTGLIVSIGITADSFIIYFERVRDEVRDGRALRAAVETGWVRARRTILISDAVNFLAAIVLYVLAASNVRGFAFTLMLTTIIDIVVVMLFTHPLLSILANTKFFGEGHKWSGLDPERLGARTVTYAGRGRVTIAARRAAAEGNQS
ncbi:MAG TPA: protein translocase subunit SecD [Dermatophilaceae bacterium]|nr:protein translocase subunit SecD [Dermatophilaceae bacterium]